ncbi:hypothetical protein HDE_04976 [Halotydeus destructor]|nr:hypothetical protein HDE_04976 [Halotydeus destructor]
MAQGNGTYEIKMNIPTMPYNCPPFTDQIGQDYPGQQLAANGGEIAIVVRPAQQYAPTIIEVPQVVVHAQPPPGARYPACMTLAPCRVFRYWQPLERGQYIRPEYQAHVASLARVGYEDLRRLEFIRWQEHPYVTPDVEAIERGMIPTERGQLFNDGAPDPEAGHYGYQVGSSGTRQDGGARVALGLLGMGSVEPTESVPKRKPPREMIPILATANPDDQRVILLSPRDADRLKGFLDQNTTIIKAEELYKGHYEEVAGYREADPEAAEVPHRVYTPEEYMLRYQGNDGSCRMADGTLEQGQWYLAFIPPHIYRPQKVVDSNGHIRSIQLINNFVERMVRIFVPNRVLKYPMYRPFTFQVPPFPQFARKADVANNVEPVIVQVPGVWARFWFPAQLNQKVIQTWWGNILVPEEDRVELVSVNKPPELAASQDHQPTFLGQPQPMLQPVVPLPEPQCNRRAPNLEFGLRVESRDPSRSGTYYKVHFTPYLMWIHPTINGNQYPAQFVNLQYPPQIIFIADNDRDIVNYRHVKVVATQPIRVPVRGTFNKSARPTGPDGKEVKAYPDSSVVLPGRNFEYIFMPFTQGIIQRLREGEHEYMAGIKFYDRVHFVGPMAGLLVDAKEPPEPLPGGVGILRTIPDGLYEKGTPETINERDGHWYRVSFPPYTQAIYPGFVDRLGNKFDQYPQQLVPVNVPQKLVWIPAAKKYMAWKIYPDDVKVQMLTGDGQHTEEVNFAPHSFDFYPCQQEGQRITSNVDYEMCRLPLSLRVLRDSGRGDPTVPDPVVSDIDPEIGLLGPLEPGQDEPIPPFAGALWTNLPSYGPMPVAGNEVFPLREGQPGPSDTRSRQNILINGGELVVVVRPTQHYAPTIVEVPQVVIQAQPPPGARYAPCPTLSPCRTYRYWQPLDYGQYIRPDYQAHFVKWLDHPYTLPGVEETLGVMHQNVPGQLMTHGTPDPQIAHYGYQTGSSGSQQPGGVRVGLGLGGLGSVEPTETVPRREPPTDVMSIPDQADPEHRRVVALVPRDAARLKGFLDQNTTIIKAEELYKGYYEEVAGYRKPNRMPPKCPTESTPRKSTCFVTRAMTALVDWPMNVRHCQNFVERIVRIFIPDRVLKYPMYRPFTFQVPPSPHFAIRADMANKVEPVVVQVPGVWARFWFPPPLNQKVIQTWWGNVLVPEEDRIELVSVSKPPELAAGQDHHPTFLAPPQPMAQPVAPPPEPKCNRSAPNLEFGFRVESSDPSNSGTYYKVHFPPHLIGVHPTLGGRKYPAQFVTLQYPAQIIFMADNDRDIVNYHHTKILQTQPCPGQHSGHLQQVRPSP